MIGATLVGMATGVSVYHLGGKMVPDFYSYAQGGSAWSSFITANVGRFTGASGVKVESVICAAAFGWIVGPWWGIATYVSPVGQGLSNAGTDALGAVALFFSMGRTTELKITNSLLPCAAHLVAGLCGLCAVASRNHLAPKWAILYGGIGAITSQWLIAKTTGQHFSGVQWRYILPAIPFWASKPSFNFYA